ncbi:MAG: tetratricopeptide repeat protein [Sciscionella sp.]
MRDPGTARRAGGTQPDATERRGFDRGTGHERPRGATGEARDNRPPEPELAEEIQFSALDPAARKDLLSLSKTTAETVGRHLVAAGMLVDDDPKEALRHARYARFRASRVAVVREAAGVAAYHAGEWAEALNEFRAVRRMTGSNAHVPVMADCERALGRPERALDLAKDMRSVSLSAEEAVELRIVVAGARRDLGQLDAAVVSLQGPDLDVARRDPWSARLFYAYADNLAAAGREDEAVRWFSCAADADVDELTDAADRAFALATTVAGIEQPVAETAERVSEPVEAVAVEGDSVGRAATAAQPLPPEDAETGE